MHKITPLKISPDANIAAAQIAKSLKEPLNLGIGTMPGHSYQPISAEVLKEGRLFLLNFLGFGDHNLTLVPAKGGGSGAISVGIAALRAMGYRPNGAAFSHWDWTGYESFCTAQGLEKNYLPSNNYDSTEPDTLMFLQTNRNGDGTRMSLAEAKEIIKLNNRLQRPNFIDLPYFTGSDEEKKVLQLFQSEATEPTIVAWSPTKIFQTFADRPGGVVLILHPNKEHFDDLQWVGGVSARGTTGFDDAVTRELWEAMATDQTTLQHKHAHYLQTIQTATECWRKNAPDWAQLYFDDENYGGMFRLFPAQSDTQQLMAASNIVPVLMQSEGEFKIRVNLCGVVQADGALIPKADTLVTQFFTFLKPQ
jgi:hypothetical protein